MVSRILVPVAFSERCKGAAQYAGALAQHFHSELVLLHVVAPIPAYSYSEPIAVPSSVLEELLPPAQAQLAAFAAETPKEIAVKTVVLVGDPAGRIVEYADSSKFDLVVMPTHGYGPFRRFLLGSVTAKVLHDTTCPVWTGPHMERSPGFSSIVMRKVLCAIDLGPDSLAVLQWAGNFAREWDASLSVIHAIPRVTLSVGSGAHEAGGITDFIKQARERILFLQEDLGLTGEIVTEAGDPSKVVRATASNIGADLVVIGRGHAAGVLGRLRTNAYAIIRESPCPVAAI